MTDWTDLMKMEVSVCRVFETQQ